MDSTEYQVMPRAAIHDSRFRGILQTAKEQGWRVEQTTRQHWRFIPPRQDVEAVVFAGTPGDFRAIRNFVAQLRKSGLVLART